MNLGILSKIVVVDDSRAEKAGELHARMKHSIKDFGLADAFVLQTAQEFQAKILTGDPHFLGFKEAVSLQSRWVTSPAL